jgi:hypothetical protein
MNTYLEIITSILTEIVEPTGRIDTHPKATAAPDEELEFQLVTDDLHGHYQVVVSGWQGKQYIHAILVQIDLRDGLVWVKADNTEYNVVQTLIERGVPKDKIVVGFHPPYWRKETGFATGE